MADVAILASQVQATPNGYTIPGGQEIILKSIRVAYDGSGAGGSFVPVMQLVAPGPAGQVVSDFPLGSTLAAGASADITWFPGVIAAASSPSGSGIQFDIDNEGNWLGVRTDYFAPWNAGPGGVFQGSGVLIQNDFTPRTQVGTDGVLTNGSNVFTAASGFFSGSYVLAGDPVVINGVTYHVNATPHALGDNFQLSAAWALPSTSNATWSYVSRDPNLGAVGLFARNGAPLNIEATLNGSATQKNPQLYLNSDGDLELDSSGDLSLFQGNNLITNGLPTSDPGVSGAFYKVAGVVHQSP